jgi:hypothetical protein
MFIARLMICADPEWIGTALENGLFSRAMQALLEVDHIPSKCLGLDAAAALLKREDGKWISVAMLDPFTWERIAELRETVEPQVIVDRAKAIMMIISAYREL